MKKILSRLSCLIALVLCIGCFASTAAFADGERQSPSDFVKNFLVDYNDFVYMGVPHEIDRYYSDMMSGEDFEKMLAAAEKDGEIFMDHQSKFRYGSDERYDEHTVVEVVTSFPSYARNFMTANRLMKAGNLREKLSYTIFINSETKGADGLIYIEAEVSESFEYYGSGSGSGGSCGFYIALYDNGSEYYICDINNDNGGSFGVFKFEDFDSERYILNWEETSFRYPSRFGTWPDMSFINASGAVNVKEPVESEPTESEATEPVQEKGTGGNAPLPAASLVAACGTVVIICLIIALFAVLSRRDKKEIGITGKGEES